MYCDISMTEDDALYFKYAIENHYWYQMYVDDLPVWGMVGELVDAQGHHIPDAASEGQGLAPQGVDVDAKTTAGALGATPLLYTHLSLSIGVNGNQIVEVNLTAEAPVRISAGTVVPFSYSVAWEETDKPFATRFRRYLDNNFFEHNIHWFSLFNAFMLVVLLVGVVALILLRTLRNDYSRYMRPDDHDVEALTSVAGEEGGWKQVHGDVFRRPPRAQLLAALLGSGFQLLLMLLVVLVVAVLATLHWYERGTLTNIILTAYAFTCAVAGYVSGAWYKRQFYPNKSPAWISVMLLTASLVPGSALGTLMLLNTVGMVYGTISTLPVGILFSLFVVWAVVSLPLVAGGTYVGRHLGGKTPPAQRVHEVARPLPKGRAWWMSPAFLTLAGGLLPFGAIFVEVYFVFTSFWNYKFYYVYGFMLLVVVMLLIVVACVSVVTTYLQLNSEDWRWQWLAFASGSSVAVYVFGYAGVYFFFRTYMSGVLQIAYYFGYSALLCLALGITLGSVSYFTASAFVKAIYAGVRLE